MKTCHTVAVCSSGAVYAWGSNHYGQLGTGASGDRVERLPVRVIIEERGEEEGSMVAAGGSHSLILTRSGRVYSFGRIFVGEIELGDNQTPQTPQLIGVPGRVVEVSAGGSHSSGSHSFALMADGTLYGWGSNSVGQLGVGDFQDRLTPSRVPVVKVASGGLPRALGDSFSMLVTEAGVIGTGSNYDGQLGVGEAHRTQSIDFQGTETLDFDECGSTDSNNCDSRAACSNIVDSFTCKCPEGFSEVNAGEFCIARPVFVTHGFVHSLLIDIHGQLFSFGGNENGQLGVGDLTERHAPTRVPGLPEARDACGGGRTQHEGGFLWCWLQTVLFLPLGRMITASWG
uniref:EGF-like domain-containing protein n=1 Tax=Chromera velia CCMP2878 TaxID=1169474 RepID=A0A0G4IFC5_9ALVE|eukprot:Cvel_2478.t1-p1 / transcript=Cvel_2478.t1 / gene=Cvel_2478 / organism=Chromera_velia_CCMP2878 / gene_product=Ultraviolet-B receptor UVR8, putative / transcript_product=Ultraviolet-B receptor UVR8, putative / location=Cvel_scaffold97:85741-87419(-) / protein_length=342 / sequence_SO=supercontig / SO=protein_coding / is_pseudo=false